MRTTWRVHKNIVIIKLSFDNCLHSNAFIIANVNTNYYNKERETIANYTSNRIYLL